MRMQHGTSHSASFFVLLLILIITVSNYFTFSKIERHLPHGASESLPTELKTRNVFSLSVYEKFETKEMRKKSFLAAPEAVQNTLEASRTNNSKAFYQSIKMEAFCEKKERIGESGDGGKYVCNPAAVKDDCTLLSLGLNNQIVYDRHIYNVTGRKCKILGADKGEQRAETKKKYEEMGGSLFQGMIPAEVTIQQMMEKSGRKEVDLLKIDIEEGEHTGLEPFLREYFVCQIFVEIHGTPAKHLEMIQKIARYGFRIFNVDENPYCAHCCEYSFINELCMSQYGVVPLAITIPTASESNATEKAQKEPKSSGVELYNKKETKEMRKKSFLAAPEAVQKTLEASRTNNSKAFYQSIKMEAFCEKKERIGESGDGGKYVCNPAAVNEDCTLLSLGLNNQIVYDRHIYDVTGRKCKILGADKGEQRAETKKKYEEMGGSLFQGMIPAEVTIQQMMEKSGRKEVDLLKIDIEEGEHTGLEPFLREYFVCQIFVEIHGTPAKHLEMIQKIARYGFRIFNVDENPYCAHCCEYSFINELCMSQYGVVPLAITIPV